MNDMQLHASCAARDGTGVLLLGASGSGKSDLLLRLLDRGFDLVADDQVLIEDGTARAPLALAGLVEVRGLGIVRLPFLAQARLGLAITLDAPLGTPERLPEPERLHGVPSIRLDPFHASAPARVETALRCALGVLTMEAGAFA